MNVFDIIMALFLRVFNQFITLLVEKNAYQVRDRHVNFLDFQFLEIY
jgi:hypothetical protein